MSENSPDDAVRRILKVGRYHLALFLLPVLSILFYGWLRAPDLNERPDNPQRTAPLHLRGRILDYNGRPLADSVGEDRVYPHGESAGSLVGYQLRGRNQTGLEAAIQDRLSPPLPPATLKAAIRQDKQIQQGERERLRGPDVQTTLDIELQQRLYESLYPASGAVVVADRQGRIRASVSSPSFDPNRVRDQWQQLRSDPRSPFIERGGSGLYPVTRPDGSNLARAGDAEKWFSSTPFPGYPLASSATWIEGRLFLTPLMMLEMAYWLDDVRPAPPLTLVMPSLEKAAASQPFEPSLERTSGPEDMDRWEFGAPPFGESPPFLASVGNVRGRLFFCVVIESRDLSSKEVEDRVLELLAEEGGSSEKW